MSHMVIYRGPDGKPGYHQTDGIHDAVGYVEQLRNDSGVEQARIFRLEEVQFEYRPYFRVELVAGEPALASGTSAPAVGIGSDTPAEVFVDPASESDSEASDSAVVDVAEVVEDVPAATPEAEVVSETVSDEAVSDEAESAAADAVETVKSKTPTITSPGSSSSDNGVGARRGLFGR